MLLYSLILVVAYIKILVAEPNTDRQKAQYSAHPNQLCYRLLGTSENWVLCLVILQDTLPCFLLCLSSYVPLMAAVLGT